MRDFAKWSRVGVFAVAGVCAVAGLLAREGTHGGLFPVESRSLWQRDLGGATVCLVPPAM